MGEFIGRMDIGNSSAASRKLPLKKLPRKPDRTTAEQRYWQGFKHPIVSKYAASIPSVAFAPTAPHDFAVASGPNVHLFHAGRNEVHKTITQFRGNVRFVTYRQDGKLLMAGGEDKRIQVFNAQSKAILRQFRAHKDTVQDAVFFNENHTQVVSASDDKTVRLFDIPTEQVVHTFLGHTDYVRCVRASPTSSDVIATASYDHTVRLWDARAQECIATFEYERPVEKVEFFPSGVALAAATGAGLIVQDVMTGKQIASFINHQKLATSLCFDGTGERLVSSSLDRQVKVYDLEKFQVAHSIKFDAPILDVAISKSNSHMVVGMSDGTLSIRRREAKTKESEEDEEEGVSEGSGFFSAAHRKFQYREALDAVLSKGDPLLVVSALEELLIRQSLQAALGGRNNQELEPILQFLYKYILNPRYNAHLFMVFHIVLDLYASVLGRAPLVDDLVMRIHL